MMKFLPSLTFLGSATMGIAVAIFYNNDIGRVIYVIGFIISMIIYLCQSNDGVVVCTNT
jgi:hypothetical protein